MLLGVYGAPGRRRTREKRAGRRERPGRERSPPLIGRVGERKQINSGQLGAEALLGGFALVLPSGWPGCPPRTAGDLRGPGRAWGGGGGDRGGTSRTSAGAARAGVADLALALEGTSGPVVLLLHVAQVGLGLYAALGVDDADGVLALPARQDAANEESGSEAGGAGDGDEDSEDGHCGVPSTA